MSKPLHHGSDGNSGNHRRLSSRQVAKLMTDYYDGQLSEAEIQELGELLDSDPDLCQEFAAQGYFHSQLYHIVLGNELFDNDNELSSESEESEKTGSFLPPVDLGDSGKGLFASFSINPTVLRGFSWIGISLLVCITIGLAWLFVAEKDSGPVLGSHYVAELTWLDKANRDAGPLSPKNSLLAKGGVLRLQNEDVHIRFACGAEVTLHGPAVFHIESEKLARLEYGTLEAKVPPQAIGFLIDTPASRVIDLGTEFQVTVADNGNTNINVLNGEVEAESWRPNLIGGDLRRKLFEGDSLKLSPPVTESFHTNFNTPDALEIFDIVRPDPATCLLDPESGLLTLRTRIGSISGERNDNTNVIVVPVPDCDFEAILKVKQFMPVKQRANHVSLAVLNDQDHIYRLSYWLNIEGKRGFAFTKEENAIHSFMKNEEGNKHLLCDMEDRPFRLRLVREGGTISTYWSEATGPWLSCGKTSSQNKLRFVGFFAAEGNWEDLADEQADCVIDSFELKLSLPEPAVEVPKIPATSE